MAIETSENDHGGITYWVTPDDDPSSLPTDIVSLVDEFDRAIFRNGDLQIARMAKICEFEPMRRWLVTLAKGGFAGLQIHTADLGHQGSVKLREVYFVFRLGGTDVLQSIQFRKSKIASLTHPALRPIFDIVDCIDPGSWGMANGQLLYNDSESALFTNMGWLQPSAEIDASKCRQLHYSLNGNVIGCHEDGSAILCNHGQLSRIGRIEEFLEIYFDLLRDGDRSVAYSEDIVNALDKKFNRVDS